MCSPRFVRCLRLLNLLQSSVGYSTSELACHLQVSHRTVYRDLRALEEAGVTRCYDHDRQGHVLAPGFHVEASALTADELAMLLMAAHVSIPSCGPEIGRVVRHAINKLLSQAPPQTRREVAGLLGTIRAGSLPDATDGQVLSQVIAAVRGRRPIRLTFVTGSEPDHWFSTKVTPRSLTQTREGWQLAGRCSWHRTTCRFDLRHVARVQTPDDYVAVRLRRAEQPITPAATAVTIRTPLAGSGTGSTVIDPIRTGGPVNGAP